MSKHVVIREFRGAVAGKLQGFQEGKILDSAEYDIALLEVSGVRMVAWTPGIEARIRGGDKRPDSVVAALMGNGGFCERVTQVSATTLVPPGDQDGSSCRPFSSIQAAWDAVPVATTGEEMRRVHVINIAPGMYDESPRLNPQGKMVLLTCDGAWTLGQFEGSGFTPTANAEFPRRDLTFIGRITQVSNLSPWVGIVGPNTWSANNTDEVKVTSPRISGQIIFEIDGAMSMQLTADVYGDTGLDTGMSIDATHVNVPLITLRMKASRIIGGITGSGLNISLMDNCRINGAVDVKRTSNVRHCNIRSAAWEVAQTPNTDIEGFMGCNIKNALTFTGPASSFMVDAYTNRSAKAAPVTLAGGATKVILGDLTA